MMRKEGKGNGSGEIGVENTRIKRGREYKMTKKKKE